MEEKELSVNLELIKGYEFRVRFDEQMAELLMDEPPPLSGGIGPNASKVLAAAVGNCLSASLLFCLRKIRVEPKLLTTTVITKMTRNEKGRLRMGSSHVTITLGFDPESRSRLSRCLDLFEDYCVVTQSVRGGVGVSVEVQDEHGEVIYNSHDKRD
jgi:organic hydroperoxide reductase OsmC/OhrA